MPFFAEGKERPKGMSLQDWVDSLEASGVEVPEEVRKELADMNSLLAEAVGNGYRRDAGEKTRGQNKDDRAAVNEAYGVIMGELPAGEKDAVDKSMGKRPAYQKMGPDGARRRLRHSSSTKSNYPEGRDWDEE